MTGSHVQSWSSTPATNATIHFPESQLPSTLNDDSRYVMAEVKEWFDEITGGTMSGVVAGTADATTLTLTPVLTAYAVNQRFLWKASGANTLAAPTLAVSGLAAKTLVGSGGAAVAIPAWSSGDMLLGIYDGTNIQLIGRGAGVGLSAVRNAQVGTTYTYLSTDNSKYVTHSNGSAIAGTLPQATGSFGSGFYMWIKNLGVGTLTITPTTSTIGGGTALVLRTGEWAFIDSDGTNYDCITSGRVTGASAVRELGTRGIPQTIQNSSATFDFGDEGSHWYHSDATPRTYTIPANASKAFPIGTTFYVINGPGAAVLTLAITTDTLQRGDGTAGTGSRSIAASSMVTIVKVTATTWMVSGSGLS